MSRIKIEIWLEHSGQHGIWMLQNQGLPASLKSGVIIVIDLYPFKYTGGLWKKRPDDFLKKSVREILSIYSHLLKNLELSMFWNKYICRERLHQKIFLKFSNIFSPDGIRTIFKDTLCNVYRNLYKNKTNALFNVYPHNISIMCLSFSNICSSYSDLVMSHNIEKHLRSIKIIICLPPYNLFYHS